MKDLSKNELATIEVLKLMVKTSSDIRSIDDLYYGQAARLAYVQYEMAYNLAVKRFGFNVAEKVLKAIDEGKL